MKVRFVNHVNHIRYKEVEVKSMEQAEEMLDDGNIYDDFDNWEYGKEYGESYVEEVENKIVLNEPPTIVLRLELNICDPLEATIVLPADEVN